MAKVAMLQCDACGEFSTQENPVMPCTVCGPRFDVCLKDQVQIIMACSPDRERVTAYVWFLWEHRNEAGRKPTLVDFDQAAETPDTVADQPEQESSATSEPEPEPEDVPAPRPAGRRRAKEAAAAAE